MGFLAVNLPTGHPLFFSSICTMNYKEKWGHKVKLTNKFCPITGLKASGLPPTTVIACKMDKLEDRMSKSFIMILRQFSLKCKLNSPRER